MTTETMPDWRPGPRAWAALTVAEAKMVVRDTAGLLIPIGLPLLILVMNGLGFGTDVAADGVPVFERYVMPVVLAIVIALVGVVNMPSFLASYRRYKVLKRLSVTPANPGMILVAQVIVSALQTIVGVGLAVAAAMLFFGVGLPERAGVAVAVFGLAALTMYAIGMLVAAVSPTPNAAIAIGLVLFFALGATGGMFGATENLPEPLSAVGELLPFGAAVQAVGNAWVGAGQNPAHLLAMAVAIAVSTAVAVTWFRWE
jgi:ABC-2 type transport system permease protein